MKGARAEPSVRTRIKPRVRSRTTIGASHHFLRTRKKLQNSRRIENFPLMSAISRQKRERSRWIERSALDGTRNIARSFGAAQDKLRTIHLKLFFVICQ